MSGFYEMWLLYGCRENYCLDLDIIKTMNKYWRVTLNKKLSALVSLALEAIVK